MYNLFCTILTQLSPQEVDQSAGHHGSLSGGHYFESPLPLLCGHDKKKKKKKLSHSLVLLDETHMHGSNPMYMGYVGVVQKSCERIIFQFLFW
jgi:hypothetical protein